MCPGFKSKILDIHLLPISPISNSNLNQNYSFQALISFRSIKIAFKRASCINLLPSFQNGGSYILAVDAGRESILSVWQWQWGHLLGKVAVIRNPN